MNYRHIKHTLAMPSPFAQRLDKVETSAIRELFKLLGKPGIISFAGGFPAILLPIVYPALFKGIYQIGAITVQFDIARAFQ